ncbi:fungal-specific transcription factor domain-containing protein [Microdochium trichocladiopsis]|uniref:Fungal-specific transcription factor domain-containing protein n=1 Tax=Microdochium trichocladiopsis TaxID=1682393 RepID=A0A9P9BQ85_9PEZI|nr:fungal-specific transcription factor domain-containing protein [Microdochium trichocladiopsis]KAH7030620.1 fungal-specific transcription factor domain-containing protein [Microdochium trichocladiopsis]
MQDSARANQVCDRCRRRKIRCAGDGSSVSLEYSVVLPGHPFSDRPQARCTPCTTAQVPCLRSTALKRNRKRKSFYENEAIQERLLEQHQDNEAVENGQSLAASAEQARHRPATFAHDLILQQASPRRHAEQGTKDLGSTPSLAPARGSQHATSTPRDYQSRPVSKLSPADPVVGHMGRLVPNDGGVSLFAGSTSGVHFVSQTEQTMQQLRLSTNQYPNSAYSLHLHSVARLGTQEDDLTLIANIVPQIQSNAITVIESTIDFLTPLYPAIHKPSSLPVYRHLLVGSGCKYPLVQLYQVLLLLAIGSIATPSPSCSRRHSHLLCHAEYYYSLATVISARAMTVSCLETLQGLVLAQIYLQVSSRGEEALQLGGVATRMAQSLGLHRHSARFKMSPLETEMRRRLWGCQSTLDTFASTYHGMPRLIRTQDVDADNPTPVDHDQMSASQIAFPLPGERSEIDYAICTFSIARTLGKTLERLYTTTDRRGGVDKIHQLRAEVELWTRTLPSEVNDDEYFNTISPHQHGRTPTGTDTAQLHNCEGQLGQIEFSTAQHSAPGASALRGSLGAMLLRIIKRITTIHIHRPALAFTSSNPQVLESLRTCTSASGDLIRIMDWITTNQSEDARHPPSVETGRTGPTNTNGSPDILRKRLFLSSLYPNGVHMLWQAGLTILFSKWKGHPIEASSTTTQGFQDASSDTGYHLVLKCASTMRSISDLCDDDDDDAPSAHGGHNSNGVNICADILEQLARKTFPNAHSPHVISWTNSDGRNDGANTTEHQQQHMASQKSKQSALDNQTGHYAEWQQQESPSWDLWDWPMASALDLANILDALPFEMSMEEDLGTMQHRP